LKFFTNVKRKGGLLLVRGYNDGQPYTEKVEYQPYLFTPTSRESVYKTIHGQAVEKREFSSISEAYQFIQRYEGVEGHKIYGLTDYQYVYLYDNFKEGFEYDFNLLNIISIDIETDSSSGFPNIDTADKEITAITLVNKGQTISFGYYDYASIKGRLYVKCQDEEELLKQFLKFWNQPEWLPDIVTGWNIEFFDIPYLINRIKRVLSERQAKCMSPFGIIEDRNVRWKNGKEFKTYQIGGLSIIDYMAAYKKFSMGEKESYSLNFIALVELKEQKLDYSVYKTLDRLYKENFKLFMDYNIHDALLVEKLEKKLHYIAQMVSIAYVQRVNFEDTVSTVKPWDVIIHNYLMDKKIVVPPMEMSESTQTIVGGYVKEPVPGLYEWVASVDFTSLYPSLAMQYNISPDSYHGMLDFRPSLTEIMFEDISDFTKELVERDLCMAPNGCLYRRAERGFFPTILKKFFDGRKIYKKQMIKAKQEYENDPDNEEKGNLYAALNNLQNAYKLIGNSGYGAFLNKYFRWFAAYLGESITLSGQMTTLFITDKVDKKLNTLFGTKDENYVIYSDTDSAYIRLDPVVKKLGLTDQKEILDVLIKVMQGTVVPFINDSCKILGEKLNVFEVTTEVKLEKICDKVIFKGKKRYVLNVLYDEGVFMTHPEIKVTGMETVRSNTPIMSRDRLKECFKIIMNKDNEALWKLVAEFRKDFDKLSFEEIGKPSGVNGLEKYYDPKTLYKKGTPAQVKASLVFNKVIKDYGLEDKYEPILDHDKVKMCYLVEENPFHEGAIATKAEMPEILDISKFIDYDRQFEAVFLKPLKDLCAVIGWSVEKTDNLEDIFG